MERILNLRKSIFFVTALAVIVVFASCSDDDNPPAPSVTDVYGSYKGKIAIASPMNRATADQSIDVIATVKDDTIFFEDFPVESIIAAIESEEDIDPILEALGKVEFKVGYKGKLNEAQDSVAMALDPKPMTFTYKTGEGEDEVEKNIAVSISTPEDEKSAYSGKVLKFKLEATEILVNEEAVDPFNTLLYNFSLNKQ